MQNAARAVEKNATIGKKILVRKNASLWPVAPCTPTRCNVSFTGKIRNCQISIPKVYIHPTTHLFHINFLWNIIPSDRLLH